MQNAFRVLFSVCFVLIACASHAQQLTIAQALDYRVKIAESEIVPAAEAMPEEKYSFAPSSGAFAGVRTFAQQVKHLAACNYRQSAYIMGLTPTPDQESETGPADLQAKAQIVAYVKESFAVLHRAIATINERNLVERLPAGPSPRVMTRLQLAELAVTHAYDHYGQMVEYLRMNGIVPPASRK